jgi:hypothetical protein
MSSTGLFSNLYSRVREYAELLDDVIIQVKSGEGGPADQRRQKLAKLLLALNQSPAADLPTQLLSILVREKSDGNTDWNEVGRALLNPELPQFVVLRLEQLAQAVEHERAGILAKMRGRGS